MTPRCAKLWWLLRHAGMRSAIAEAVYSAWCAAAVAGLLARILTTADPGDLFVAGPAVVRQRRLCKLPLAAVLAPAHRAPLLAGCLLTSC